MEALNAESNCYLCRGKTVQNSSSNFNSVIIAWAESCAKSLREVLTLDESHQWLFDSAVYCKSCLTLVRDTQFVMKLIDSLQARLASSRKRVEGLIRRNYYTVIREAAYFDPLENSNFNPCNIFIQTVGEALGFENEIDTKEDLKKTFSSVDASYTATGLSNENPSSIQPHLRPRSTRKLQRSRISQNADVYFNSDSNNSDSETKSLDQDFDPGHESHYEDEDEEINPVSDQSRLNALVKRQRQLKHTRHVFSREPGASTRDLTPFHCSCGRRFVSQKNLKRHRQLKCPTLRRKNKGNSQLSGRERIKCEYDDCKYRTFNESRYSAHRNTVHGEDPDTPYHCPHYGCGKRFGSQHYLRIHLRNGLCMVNQAQEGSKNASELPDNPNYDSTPPDHQSNTETSDPNKRRREIGFACRLKNEKKFVDRKKINCAEEGCKFHTFSQFGLETHVRKKHNNESDPFPCNFCEMKFSKLTMLREHNKNCPVPWKDLKVRKKRQINASVANQCEICSKRFRTQNDMNTHFNLHKQREAENPHMTFSCVMPGCDKWFVCSLELRAHVARGHEDVGFKCQLCGLVLLTANRLQNHMTNLHTAPNPAWKCPEPDCPYFAKSKSDLKNHSVKHTGARNHQCATCGKSFAWTKSLVTHMRVHENYRPYKCHFANCTKSFTTSDRLRSHEEFHSTVRSFLCSLCPKAYKTTKCLHQHLRLTHKLTQNLQQYSLHKKTW